MSELRAILVEQVDRLLAARVTPDLLRALEQPLWPDALWAELTALGLPLAMAPEAMGGAGLGWDDAVAVWQAMGRHGAPVPLAESMAAAALLAASGIAPPEGLIGFLWPSGDGHPWGRRLDHVMWVLDGRILCRPARVVKEDRHPISRLPYDGRLPSSPVKFEVELPAALGPDAELLAGALIHAAQISGALETVLDMTVDYANTRKQFGRPIGGFQAVQQLLARAAGEVAAAGVAAAWAGQAATRHGLAGAGFEIAAAKIVCGEAAGTCAAIAHQVFAAIGFTQEHHLHLFTRRLWAWRDEFGAERVWARRIGGAALAEGSAALWPGLTARG